MIRKYLDKEPVIHPTAFIAESADVIGEVEIGERSSVWYSTVIRGDVDRIVFGNFTNIQDGSVVHSSTGLPTILGDYVSVGHGVILHGCVIGNNCLIGMGAIILDGVEIGDNVIVGAGSLVTQGKKIPSNSLVLGAPAKVVRELSEREINSIRETSEHYSDKIDDYKNSL
ncbi:MAG: Carbonic anhydrase, gamma class [Firmicutes bacterium]|nr:Carbonic anhydrase, gamma class [Bacillota bacterium]MDI6706626.1 gamma carbonic anhydrase family protein [Bacillota bacterium]